ncbi:MAG: zinc metalloprotease, partial [Myxococcales bacterium]
MTVLLYILGVLVFMIGLAVSIGLHELGHLVPARRFGAKVTQYFVGFGPTAWSRVRGETEWGVKWLPLGGYVKIVGMFPPAPGEDKVRSSNTGLFTQLISDARAAEWEFITPADSDRLFYKMPPWKKIVVMAGGPMVNIVLAFLAFAAVFGIHGVAETTTRVATVSDCVIAVRVGEEPRVCTDRDPLSPAAKAGLEPGDRIE